MKFIRVSPRKLLQYIGYIFLGGIFVLEMEKIATWLLHQLTKFNINSRTLRLLLIGKLSSLSNRDLIASEILKIISDNAAFGIGFLGDLRSHNIGLETFLFYGVVVGTTLLLLLLYIIIKSILFKSNRTLALLIIIFFSYAIPDAFLNLTVWGKDMFWIYMGLSLSTFRRSKLPNTMNSDRNK